MMTKIDRSSTWRLAAGMMDCEWCRVHQRVQVVPHDYGASPTADRRSRLPCSRAELRRSEGEHLELSDDGRWRVEDDALWAS